MVLTPTTHELALPVLPNAKDTHPRAAQTGVPFAPHAQKLDSSTKAARAWRRGGNQSIRTEDSSWSYSHDLAGAVQGWDTRSDPSSTVWPGVKCSIFPSRGSPHWSGHTSHTQKKRCDGGWGCSPVDRVLA